MSYAEIGRYCTCSKNAAYKSHRVDSTDWNDRGKAKQWRSAWSDYVNRSLEQNGIKERVDHRSYKRQGVDKIPSVHMGVTATQMERQGIATDKGNLNREIAAQNKLLKEMKARTTCLYNWSKENAKQPEKASILELLKQPTQDKPTSTHGKVKALKESAALFHFLQSNGITDYVELAARAEDAREKFDTLSLRVKQIEGRMAEVAQLKTHIINCSKTHEAYAAYKKSRHKKEYRTEHLAELETHEATKAAFDALNGKLILKVAQLSKEYAALLAEKNARYEDFKAARKEMIDYQTAKQNIDRILGVEQEQAAQEKQKESER